MKQHIGSTPKPLNDEDRANNAKLRTDTGNIEFSDKLTMFLYLLLRDHMNGGTIEQLVRDAQIADGGVKYTNGYVAQYANNLASRLQ